MSKVAIIMGSASDWDVMSPACVTLEEFGIPYEKRVLSAHRNPGPLADYVRAARDNGFDIIIAGAGGAAHLPGVIAALTTLPVIGVPVKSKALNGLDSLLSIVQMPSGIPVATMAIDGAKNAALYAVAILALQDDALRKKLEDFRGERDTMDEVFENKEQIEISKYYERQPKPDLVAISEFENGELYYRRAQSANPIDINGEE